MLKIYLFSQEQMLIMCNYAHRYLQIIKFINSHCARYHAYESQWPNKHTNIGLARKTRLWEENRHQHEQHHRTEEEGNCEKKTCNNKNNIIKQKERIDTMERTFILNISISTNNREKLCWEKNTYIYCFRIGIYTPITNKWNKQR